MLLTAMRSVDWNYAVTVKALGAVLRCSSGKLERMSAKDSMRVSEYAITMYEKTSI